MNRDNVAAVLYDMALVVGGEVRLRPLLTRSLQRLLYHTSFPVGLVFLSPPPAAGGEIEARLELGIGDWELGERAGQVLRLPAALLEGEADLVEDARLLATLPGGAGRYAAFLRLPLDGQGVVLLLAPRAPRSELPLASVFRPVVSNLARAIVLCRANEAHQAQLEAERDAARQGLVASFETLRAMTDAALDAIVMCDREGRISYWNPSAERVFGYAAPEVLGRDLHDLLTPPRYRERIRERFRTFASTGQGDALGKVFELEAVRRDGTEFPVEVSISPVRLGGSWTAVGILRDVGDRKKLEDQFRQAQKLDSVARLAGGVAHDFNNLLTAILGGVEALLAGLGDSDPLRADAEDIHAAATRASGLTGQLLLFSRKEAAAPRILDLNEIVAGMGRMLQRLIGEDVELAISAAPVLGPVKVDAGLLEQVLLNLVLNARDAMPGGGRITIETGDLEVTPEMATHCAEGGPGPHVRLAVRDTGCGMSAEVQSHLFEPFFTTKEVGKGTGLGLATVYGIVKQAGGHLHVTSAPGRGSLFEVLLPRAAAAQAGAGGVGEEPRATDGRGSECVLLVEDDSLVRRVTGKVLREAGYEVLEAVDGGAALQLAAGSTRRIDALVSDVVMPGMRGPELARRLVGALPGLVVLFVTGYADHAEALEPFGDRAAILQKPFTSLALSLAVRSLLDRRPAPGPRGEPASPPSRGPAPHPVASG